MLLVIASPLWWLPNTTPYSQCKTPSMWQSSNTLLRVYLIVVKEPYPLSPLLQKTLPPSRMCMTYVMMHMTCELRRSWHNSCSTNNLPRYAYAPTRLNSPHIRTLLCKVGTVLAGPFAAWHRSQQLCMSLLVKYLLVLTKKIHLLRET